MSRLRNWLARKNVKVKEKQTFTCNVEDYNGTYDIPRFIFKTLGIRLTYKDSTFARLCWNIFYWIGYTGVSVAAAQEAGYMIAVAQLGTFQAVVEIIRMTPCLGYTLLGMSKCYKLVYYRPAFEKMIDEMREQWPRGPVTEEEHTIATTAVKHLNFVIRGYYWCNNLLLVLYMTPSFVQWLKLMAGYDTPRVLHFFFWFPFDPHQPYVHEFLLLYQTWLAYVAVMSLLCGDMMFCVLLSHIATQFELLSCKIRRLFYVPIDDQLPDTYPLAQDTMNYLNDHRRTATFDSEAWEAKQRSDLIDIVNRHRHLISIAGDIEDMHSFSLLLNFCNSSIIICFCGFCCVIVEKMTEMIYKSFLVAALVQTWVLCWYGQRLFESSQGVSHALYKSGWYGTSKTIRSAIFIIMHRSQKPVKVTTYGFSVVSLASFTMIIKTAWSYFTLLLNVYKK